MSSQPHDQHLHEGIAPEPGRNVPASHASDPDDELSRLAHAQARFLDRIIQAVVEALRADTAPGAAALTPDDYGPVLPEQRPV